MTPEQLQSKIQFHAAEIDTLVDHYLPGSIKLIINRHQEAIQSAQQQLQQAASPTPEKAE